MRAHASVEAAHRLGQSHALARTRGIAGGRPSAATTAKVAPIMNAALAPLWSHTYPNRIDAGNAPSPIARLYQPNAVPRRAGPTRSATSARSLPSVNPKKIPYTPKSAHASHATPATAK